MNFTRIITHPGVFHADDVCAVAYAEMLQLVPPETVERREPTEAELDDQQILVLDIGGQNDIRNGNFDHHQRGGAGARWDSDIPYSSFGLLTDSFRHTNGIVADRIDEVLVQAIDALDNGFGTVESNVPLFSISHAISMFNPALSNVPDITRDASFRIAVNWVKPLIKNVVFQAEEWASAKEKVLQSETRLDDQVLGQLLGLLEGLLGGGHVVVSDSDEISHWCSCSGIWIRPLRRG